MTENQEIEKWESKAKNNQYCQYDRLPVLLKRYSFAEKMRICYEYSSRFLQKRKSSKSQIISWLSPSIHIGDFSYVISRSDRVSEPLIHWQKRM